MISIGMSCLKFMCIYMWVKVVIVRFELLMDMAQRGLVNSLEAPSIYINCFDEHFVGNWWIMLVVHTLVVGGKACIGIDLIYRFSVV